MKGKNKQINSEDREFQIDGDTFKEKRKVTTFSNDPLKSESATTIIEHIRSIKGDLIWNDCFWFSIIEPTILHSIFSYILRRPQNFAKSSPYFCPM